MTKPPISLDMSIRDLLMDYPEVVPAFLNHKMNCVGCIMAKFMTLKDAIVIYRLNEEVFLGEIKKLAETSREQKTKGTKIE